MPGDNKTEKATPKRRKDERKKGNVLKSQDVSAVVGLTVAFVVFRLLVGYDAEQLGRFFLFCIESCVQSGDLTGWVSEFWMQLLLVAAKTVLPLMAVVLVTGVAVTLFQTKFLVTTEPLKPKLSRLNPIEGIKRLFSLHSIIEALKGILKIAVLLVLVYRSVKKLVLSASRYIYMDISTACSQLLSSLMSMLIGVIIAFIVIAALDYLYQWWDFERKLKMTKEEVKEEYKQTEGDPKVKGKIRQIQRQRAQSRMMQKVPQADVVIKNPTHFAVALRYKPEVDAAPIVLAKGQDELALRIIKLAEENQVTVIENIPLARALYAKAELDQAIPPELYNAVAEVLVYIFRLNDKQQIVK